MKTLLIRLFQKILYLTSFFLPFKEPKVIKGEDSFFRLALLIKGKGFKKVFLITGKKLHSLNMDKKVYDALKKEGIGYVLYYGFSQDPEVNEIEDGLKIYKENNCDCIIAIGGGTVMDGAKVIAARITNQKSVRKMKGLLKITHKLPFLCTIPTTAGTGSETTIAAVVSNSEAKEKYPIEDPHLIPSYAILNPSLLTELPGNVTAATGMDALTHAIEAYIGHSNTRKTKKYAKEAVKLIFDNLYPSYLDGKNLTYRENMLVASYDAGVAFTRAYVGYVHALAHALGAFYHLPHGLLNAILLPKVLKAYGSKADKKLAELYDVVSDGNKDKSIKDKADSFIFMIEDLNKKMEIPENLKGIIQEEDIGALANHSFKEAIPLYPTPLIWTRKDFEKIYQELSN